jgi:hypothetical protein
MRLEPTFSQVQALAYFGLLASRVAAGEESLAFGDQTPGTAKTSSSPEPSRNFFTLAYSGEFQTDRITSIDGNSNTISRRPS